MSDLTPDHLHILRHSLGLNQSGRAYRNHFCTDVDSPDGQLCTQLVGMGLMIDHGKLSFTGTMHTFAVTDKGRAECTAAKAKEKKLTRSQLRYQAYLDADSGLSFSEWIRSPQSKYALLPHCLQPH